MGTILPGISPGRVEAQKPAFVKTGKVTNMEGARPLLVDAGLQSTEMNIQQKTFSTDIPNSNGEMYSFTWQDMNHNGKFEPDIDGYSMYADGPYTPDNKSSIIRYRSANFVPEFGGSRKKGEDFQGSVTQFNKDLQQVSETVYFGVNDSRREKTEQVFTKKQEDEIRKLATDYLLRQVNQNK